ncbi:MAG: calcium-binding protein [Ramlibacter sp.]
MTTSTFYDEWVSKLKSASNWDAADFTFSTLSTFFAGLADLQAKAIQGTLNAAEVPKYINSYEAWYGALAKVNAEMASQASTLTEAEAKVFAALRQQENQLKFLMDRLHESGVTKANITTAGRALGVFVGLAQIISEVGDGSWDDVAAVSVGVVVGYAAGSVIAVGIATAGIVTGPVGWLAAAVFVAGSSVYLGDKAKAAWLDNISSDSENLRREMLKEIEKVFGADSPAYEEMRAALQYSADKLGKLDGTWLEGFTDMAPGDKAYLTFAMFAPAGVRFTDAYWRDMDDLFSTEFEGALLPLRDAALKALAQVAIFSPSYAAQRVQVGEDGVLRVDLEGATTALYDVADSAQKLVGAADSDHFTLTPPSKLVIATAGGTATGTSADELLVGSTQADTLEGEGGRDVIVAGAGADVLRGGEGMDDLFGGEGDDTLDGGAGGDYLYGGAGNDKYALNTGELGDVIRDADGNGTIWVDGVQLTGGKKVSSSYWISDDKTWAYMLMTNGDLVILRDSSLDRVVIRDWQSKDQKLGIDLQDTPAPAPAPAPPPSATITGTNETDVLTGTAASELILGLGGGDIIDARAGGDNILDGGAGNDIVMGGDGVDTIMGGSGRDVLFAYGGDDEVWGGNKSDFDTVNNQLEAAPDDEADLIAGGWNDDRLYGGAGSDAMFGGGSGDFIVAGAGDDNILADYYAGDTNVSWQLVRQTVTQPDGSRRYVLTFVHTGYELGLEPGNDIIFAGAGADWVMAGAADDLVDAGSGDDVVYGMAGDDVIDGGDENDHLHGDGTYSSATSLDYTPLDQHGNDILYGGRGNDTLSGQGGNDYLDGEEYDDTLMGGSGEDDLFGGDGSDVLNGDEDDLEGTLHGGDYLDGEDGNDTLVGNGGGDDLFGGIGDDQLVGDDDASRLEGQFHGADYLDGEAGDDTSWGGGGDDTLFGGIGHDMLLGDDGPGLDGQYHGADYLDGEDGNDTLVGGGSNDTLYGGVGNDLLLGDASDLGAQHHGADYMDGEDGDDTLIGGGSNDTVFGGVGNDSMYGDSDELPEAQHGNDYLDGEDGADSLDGQGGNDTLFGGAGLDTLFGSAGDDLLAGGADNDSLIGGEGADTLFSDAGDDALWGDAGEDYLDGGDGNDQLVGGDGNDQLDGGADNDTMSAGMGSDTLLGSEGNDWLQGEQDDDLLDGGGANDTVLAGTGNDSLLGGEGDDWLQGDAGNDLLDGGAGHDTLRGGDGDDTLVGSASDVLVGGAGNDTYIVDLSSPHSMATDYIEDTEGSNHIRFSGVTAAQLSLTPSLVQGFLELTTPSGSMGIRNLLTDFATVQVGDSTYSSARFFGLTYAWEVTQSESIVGAALQGGKLGDTLTSTGGGATLAGGVGNDTLTASGGNNSYLYFMDDGEDTIDDTSAAAQRGTVVLGTGLTPDDLTLAVEDGTLVVTFGENKPGALRISGFTAANAAAIPAVALYRFSDGSELTHEQLVERGFDIAGTAGSDSVTGTNLTDRITGGPGDDTLAGGAGADTYLFNRGDGSDLLADGDAAAGAGDTLRFGEGITPEEVRALRNGNDVTLVLGSDQATLKSYFGGGADAVEQIVFADGTQWTQQDVLAAVAAGESQDWVIVGDAGNNLLRGLGGNDLLDGGGGADTLFGATGNDTLIGGPGWDTLYGQAGSDTYVVAPGAQRDTIDERDGGDTQDADVLRFEQVSRGDVSITASGNEVSFYYAGSGSVPWFQAVVSGQFDSDSAANQVERFEFADGTVMTAQDLKTFLLRSSAGDDWIQGFSTADTIAGGWGRDTLIAGGGDDSLYGEEGDDQLYGDQGNDALHGGAGDDTLYGYDGADTLAGGAGWDRLDGGAGSDTYLFGAGDGMDIVVSDSDGIDSLRLAGVSAANVTLYRVSSPPAANIAYRGDSLVIQLNSGSDQLWIANYFDAATQGYVENIVLDDGTSWDYATVMSRLVAPAQGGSADTQTGTTRANTFTVDHWSDVVNDPSYTDNDTAAASVSWKLPDTVNNLNLTGSLNLFAQGGAWTDTLRGNTGSNWFEYVVTDGGGYPDTMIGGAGDDVYVVRADMQDVVPDADPSDLGGAVIVELAGQGIDTLITGYWSARLPDHVENLAMARPNAMDELSFRSNQTSDYTHRLIGNSLGNVIDSTLYESAASSQQWFSDRDRPSWTNLLSFRLDGGAGADTLVGGIWHNIYVIDNPQDVVVETGVDKDGNDRSNDTVETPLETSLLTQYSNIENVTLVGTAAVSATGDHRNNRLDGSLNSAANLLAGGLGDDVYVVGVGDVVVENVGEGIDTLLVPIGFNGTLRLADYPNVEHLRLLAQAGSLDAAGTAEDNELTGSLADNRLWGEDGDDVLADQYLGDILYTNKYREVVVNAAADQDQLYGGAGDDVLVSRGGVDMLDGGAGDDTLRVHYAGRSTVIRFGLGDGHDVLQQDAGTSVDVTIELKPGVGVLEVQLTLEAGRLRLTLADGSSLELDAGNPVRLTFADGMVLGTAQIEAMLRTGDRTTPTEQADLLLGTAAAETVASLGGNDAVYGGAGADHLDGGTGNDLLFGGDGNDTLVGGTGNDTLAGGPGGDVYRFSRGFGQDVVNDSYTGGAPAADDGAVDVIEFDDSVAPADVVILRRMGPNGPDGLIIALPATGDRLTLENTYAATGSVELVRFANGTQWDLAALKSRIVGEVGDEGNNVLTAPAIGAWLEGMAGNDTLNGSSGQDTLDGGSGSDSMAGGAGNDTYIVDSLGDSVVEAGRSGTDTVIASVDGYVLPAKVEQLQLAAGTDPLGGTGNARANTLIGNAGNNRLDGGAGADAMLGGAGDDTYVVDATGDVITELAAEGNDWVEASITHSLGDNVENLRLMGTRKINGTGNALDNILMGNSADNSLNGGGGNDRLDGGAGADAMTGAAGNDTFVVDNTSDVVVEAAGGGIDTVETSVTLAALAAQVERLILTASNAVNGTGNAQANWMLGNDAANVLNGAGGADILIGGGGNDTLQDTVDNGAFDGGQGLDNLAGAAGAELFAGGSGNDTLTLGGGSDIVSFNRGDGADTVNAPGSGSGLGERDDTVSLGAIRLSDIRLAHDGADLLLKVAGTGDALRIKDWYVSADHQTIDRLQVVTDSSADYAPGSSDPLRGERVIVLEFGQLVAAFNSAKAANPSLGDWALSDSLLQSALLSGSDSLAWGGYLAYRYAHDGTLAYTDYEASTGQLAASGFGSSGQDILQGSGGAVSVQSFSPQVSLVGVLEQQETV